MNPEIFRRFAAFVSRIHDMEIDLGRDAYHDSLTPMQHQALQVLYFAGPQNLTGLAHCLGINLPNCSREVRKLRDLALLKKGHDSVDRRVVHIDLTSEGRATVESVLDQMQDAFATKIGVLRDEDSQACIDALDTLERIVLDPYLK